MRKEKYGVASAIGLSGVGAGVGDGGSGTGDGGSGFGAAFHQIIKLKQIKK